MEDLEVGRKQGGEIIMLLLSWSCQHTAGLEREERATGDNMVVYIAGGGVWLLLPVVLSGCQQVFASVFHRLLYVDS